MREFSLSSPLTAAGLHQGSRHLECWLYPRRDDQQQASLPREALPGPDLQDPGGPGDAKQGGPFFHHQPEGSALCE